MADSRTVLQQLDALEKRDGELAQAAADLRDAITVTAEIQRRQARVQRSQAEWLEELEKSRREQEKSRRERETAIKRTEMNLAEITDKLDGLIGFMD